MCHHISWEPTADIDHYKYWSILYRAEPIGSFGGFRDWSRKCRDRNEAIWSKKPRGMSNFTSGSVKNSGITYSFLIIDDNVVHIADILFTDTQVAGWYIVDTVVGISWATVGRHDDDVQSWFWKISQTWPTFYPLCRRFDDGRLGLLSLFSFPVSMELTSDLESSWPCLHLRRYAVGVEAAYPHAPSAGPPNPGHLIWRHEGVYVLWGKRRPPPRIEVIRWMGFIQAIQIYIIRYDYTYWL